MRRTLSLPSQVLAVALLLSFVVVALVVASVFAGPLLAQSAVHSLLAHVGPQPMCSGATGGSCV